MNIVSTVKWAFFSASSFWDFVHLPIGAEKNSTWHPKHYPLSLLPTQCNLDFYRKLSLAMLVMMKGLRVALGTDHAGFTLKEVVKKHLIAQGIDVLDFGTFSGEQCDYPPFIEQACSAVLEHSCFGIVFGGSGNGEAMVANKVPGIRCARCVSLWDSEMARKHNDAQVMSLGGRITEPKLACEMVDLFLSTPFEGGRHLRRIAMFPDVQQS